MCALLHCFPFLSLKWFIEGQGSNMSRAWMFAVYCPCKSLCIWSFFHVSSCFATVFFCMWLFTLWHTGILLLTQLLMMIKVVQIYRTQITKLTPMHAFYSEQRISNFPNHTCLLQFFLGDNIVFTGQSKDVAFHGVFSQWDVARTPLSGGDQEESEIQGWATLACCPWLLVKE